MSSKYRALTYKTKKLIFEVYNGRGIFLFNFMKQQSIDIPHLSYLTLKIALIEKMYEKNFMLGLVKTCLCSIKSYDKDYFVLWR